MFVVVVVVVVVVAAAVVMLASCWRRVVAMEGALELAGWRYERTVWYTARTVLNSTEQYDTYVPQAVMAAISIVIQHWFVHLKGMGYK